MPALKIGELQRLYGFRPASGIVRHENKNTPRELLKHV